MLIRVYMHVHTYASVLLCICVLGGRLDEEDIGRGSVLHVSAALKQLRDDAKLAWLQLENQYRQDARDQRRKARASAAAAAKATAVSNTDYSNTAALRKLASQIADQVDDLKAFIATETNRLHYEGIVARVEDQWGEIASAIQGNRSMSQKLSSMSVLQQELQDVHAYSEELTERHFAAHRRQSPVYSNAIILLSTFFADLIGRHSDAGQLFQRRVRTQQLDFPHVQPALQAVVVVGVVALDVVLIYLTVMLLTGTSYAH
jgi:hypothetical protein